MRCGSHRSTGWPIRPLGLPRVLSTRRLPATRSSGVGSVGGRNCQTVIEIRPRAGYPETGPYKRPGDLEWQCAGLAFSSSIANLPVAGLNLARSSIGATFAIGLRPPSCVSAGDRAPIAAHCQAAAWRAVATNGTAAREPTASSCGTCPPTPAAPPARGSCARCWRRICWLRLGWGRCGWCPSAS